MCLVVFEESRLLLAAWLEAKLFLVPSLEARLRVSMELSRLLSAVIHVVFPLPTDATSSSWASCRVSEDEVGCRFAGRTSL